MLASCSGSNKILQISCTYGSVETSSSNDFKPKYSSFIFDSSTGKAYEYSEFHEKLVLIEGVTEDKWGGRYKSESIIVNDVLKIDASYTPKARPGRSSKPDLYEYRIDLKNLILTEKHDSGAEQRFDYTATGICKYTKPKTTEIHRDH